MGRLGTSATGAVGIVYPLMTLIMALGLMFGKGTGTLMGRQLGRQETRKAEETAVQGLVYVISLVGFLMLLGLLFIHPLVSLLKNGLSSLASVLLNRAARPYGDAVIAAFMIVNRLVHMCQQIYFGIGEGYQTVCSYNYGARQYRRVKEGFWFCIKIGAALLTVIVIAFLFPEQIIGLFRKDDPEVILYGSWILRAHMATLSLLPVCSTGFVMLQGIGRNRDATIIGSGRQGLFLLPLILILPRFLGAAGLIAVQPCSDVLSTILGILILRPNLKKLETKEEAAV